MRNQQRQRNDVHAPRAVLVVLKTVRQRRSARKRLRVLSQIYRSLRRRVSTVKKKKKKGKLIANWICVERRLRLDQSIKDILQSSKRAKKRTKKNEDDVSA